MSKVQGSDFKNSTDLAGNLANLPNDTKFYVSSTSKTLFQSITDGNIGGTVGPPTIVTNSSSGNYSMSSSVDGTFILHTATSNATYQLPTPSSASKRFYFLNNADPIIPVSSARIQPAAGHIIRVGNQVVENPGYISLDKKGPVVLIAAFDSTTWVVLDNVSQSILKNIGIGNPKEVKLVGRDTWTSKANLSLAKRGPASFTFNGYSYAQGGANGATFYSTTEQYNDSSDSWTTKTNGNTTPRDAAAFAFNGFGYVIGGVITSGGDSTSAVNRYNDSANTWASKAVYPTNTNGGWGDQLNGYGYQLGGNPATSGGGANAVSSTYRYNDNLDSWTSRANLNSANTENSRSATLNGYIYRVGGSGAATTSTVDQYNDSLNSFISRAITSNSQWDGQYIMSFNGFLFEAGGQQSGGTVSNSYQYNDSLNNWTTMSGNLAAAQRLGGCSALNGYGYAYGGLTISNTYQYN